MSKADKLSALHWLRLRRAEPMTLALLTLIAPLVGLAAWLIKRGLTKHDDPLEQHRERCRQAEADVASPNASAVSQHGVDDLAELERLQKSKSPAQR